MMFNLIFHFFSIWILLEPGRPYKNFSSIFWSILSNRNWKQNSKIKSRKSFALVLKISTIVTKQLAYIALKMSVFGVFRVRIFSHLNWRQDFVSLRIQSKCSKMLTRKTPNTDTFYAVILIWNILDINKNIEVFLLIYKSNVLL